MKRLIAFAVLFAGSSLAVLQPLMADDKVVVVKTHHRRHRRHHHAVVVVAH
jgi:hypothetical protein